MVNSLIRSTFFVLSAFFVFSFVLWIILKLNPSLQLSSLELESNRKELQFPRSIEELKDVVFILQELKEKHFVYVLSLFSAAFIYKQTFAIPGSALLNVLAGALFGVRVAVPLVCILSALGASSCFFLSKASIAPFLDKWKPEKVAWLRNQMRKEPMEQLLFLISLRIFPVTPNWLINMAAPVADVPSHLFFLSVFTGLAPYNTVCVLAGSSLSQLKSTRDLFSTTTLLSFLVIAIILYALSRLTAKFKIISSDTLDDYNTKVQIKLN